jgi:MoCo/4Fe-4S cofactor protein with predicted Tat translocation signal
MPSLRGNEVSMDQREVNKFENVETGLNAPQALDFQKIKERLAGSQGKNYWRSLEEVAQSPQFENWIDDEFPNRSELKGIDRRDFLKFMGASLLMASLTGCRSVFQAQEKLVPYVKGPEDLIPGKKVYFATAVNRGGYATGVLVSTNMGRPIKIDGNPEHPASLGAVDPMTQASVLDLYDPDRSQSILLGGTLSTWDRFLTELRQKLDAQEAKKGAGLVLLTETITSPTLLDQINQILSKYPNAKWCQYEALDRANVHAGAQAAFGEKVHTYYNLKGAKTILSIDADFLGAMHPSVRMTKDYAFNRQIKGKNADLNRLYVVETTFSLTGANADHRLPLSSDAIYDFTKALAIELGAISGSNSSLPKGVSSVWLKELAADLKQCSGKSAVIVGDHADSRVHALVHAVNHKLQNIGKSVICTAPIETEIPGKSISIADLMNQMARGSVSELLIMGVNPVFTAPKVQIQGRSYSFADSLKKVPFSVHLGTHADETATLCKWHIPQSHYLEAWGDAKAFDGTATVVQPLISPLYPTTKSPVEIFSAVLQSTEDPYETVKTYWAKKVNSGSIDEFWEKSLDRGVVQGTALPPKNVSIKLNTLFLNNLNKQNARLAKSGQYFLELRYDPTIYDGRFANNGWLQELPKPLTKLTWDNSAQMSPATAEKLGLSNHDKVELNGGSGRKVVAPVWIVPGHPDENITVHVGYGRTKAGMVGKDTGFNAYLLQGSDTVAIKKVPGQWTLATTQMHQNMEGRDLVRVGTVQQFLSNPNLEPKGEHKENISLYPDDVQPYDGHKWAMLIDLNLCTGCSACVTSCQAENNIPVVGKTQVIRGRQMQWLRIDTYYGPRTETSKDALSNPSVFLQPVTCMHCEKAPCEPVCPVAATVHSHEGLNQMVYNRCIGTRYCSNNCPYKVRRFNFLNFNDKVDHPVKLLANNPRVTVRGRGVMEKCTYCVQLINEARIEAKKEGRPVRDGEIITACQQACPTQAIVFGDISDPNSKVSKLKQEPREYKLLEELNTRPRTSYLVKLRNPNKKMEA